MDDPLVDVVEPTSDEAPAEPRRWGVVSPAHRSLLWDTRYRTWPRLLAECGDVPGALSPRSFTTRAQAERWARETLVPAYGSGTAAELTPAGLFGYGARFDGHVSDADIARAESLSGLVIPAGWRRYWQRPSWLAKGSLGGADSVRIFPPDEAVDLTDVWTDERDDLPHVLVIGGNGGSENLVVDVREENSPVFALPNVCEGWEQRVEQAADVEAFIAAIEDGSFAFRFE